MDKKYENGMSLEQLIGEMLKDAKVVKIPIQQKSADEQEVQKSDKPLAETPPVAINIENLHIHMDERMTSYNNFDGDSDEVDAIEEDAIEEDEPEDIDVDAMISLIKAKTGLCEKVILAVLVAQDEYLDSIWGEDAGKEDEE